ncbi:Piso0_001349 [Millerozyma farinosa CBS 7064]|uniref:Piso0_001349 protein n=1 Tax=Pichia sorbitophila (strain ATCC MYA-4447 / BCRC 22081 / CBS 7064 / NBRC 10061 / NRRL Y-12695) TaxID=559304 RepID=G8YMI4_PICSO|nr:Piso0_001349 [Millerozyma farinosa CBS 7064]
MLHRKSVAAGLQDLPSSQDATTAQTNSFIICEDIRNENNSHINTTELADNSIGFALSLNSKLCMTFQPLEKENNTFLLYEFEHKAKRLLDKEARDNLSSAEKRIELLMSSDQITQIADYFRHTSKLTCTACDERESHHSSNNLNRANTYSVHLQKQSVGSWIVVFPQTSSVVTLSFHIAWIYTVLQTYNRIEFTTTTSELFDLRKSCADMRLNVKLKGSHSAFGYRALIMMGEPVSVTASSTIPEVLMSKCAISSTTFQCSPSPIGWQRPVYKLKPDMTCSPADLSEQEPRNEKNTTSKLIRLRKSEVSFLLGLQGHRLNHIRRTTGCAIKTMPIETPGVGSTFLPIRNASQSLLLCGTYENVNAAVELISSYLVTHKQNSTFW